MNELKAIIREDKIVGIFKDIPASIKEVPYVDRLDLRSDNELLEIGLKVVSVEQPEYDKIMQKLGIPTWSKENQCVVYPVINLEFNLDELLQKRLAEFEELQKEFRREITELFLEDIALGTLPDSVKNLINQLNQRKTEIVAELEGFYNSQNTERLVKYSFYTAETEQFKTTLKELKQ